ncbi:MAG TPA: hypothetical protein VGE66_04260 [Chitinophagaceae bacterium]
MSSNQPHINITRSNYEDFFLLYVDGELTPEECDAVEAFAAAHPDLQEELDILLTTRLNAEPVVFLDKQSLMADSMKMNNIDESLLSYIDGELKGEEKAMVEWELEHNKELQAQHQLLLKTKLDPTEKIVYPYKEELYRRTERSVRPLFWMRAAAVVILVSWGAFWYLDNYGSDQPGSDMAMGNAPAATIPAPITAPSVPTAEVTTPEAETTPSSDVSITPVYTPAEEQAVAATTVDANPVARTATRADYREDVTGPVVIAANVPVDTDPAMDRSRVETIASAPQQIINDPAVTDRTTATYNPIEVPTGDDTRGSVAREDNDKKGSMRGFLRKTTRFIERRTGIDPTNEGDELMIGALTISLK